MSEIMSWSATAAAAVAIKIVSVLTDRRLSLADSECEVSSVSSVSEYT